VIFVDTGAWYARYVAEDVDHAAGLGCVLEIGFASADIANRKKKQAVS
jgi:predicted nucleic acid-binding protein